MIFKTLEVFKPEYIPKKIPFREEEYEFIKNMLNTLKFNNILQMQLVGMKGTGKTVTLKKALTDLDIPHYYVVCEHTEYLTFLEICKAVLGKSKPGLGMLPWDEVLPILKDKLLVLDEADKFMIKGGDELLYRITNSSISLVLVSNRHDLMNMVRDSRVQSRLMPIKVNFRPYKLEELKLIILERAREALEDAEKVLEDNILTMIAEIVQKKNNDARYALLLTKQSILLAAGGGHEKVTPEIVKKANEILENMELEQDLNMLTPQQKLMLLCALNFNRVGTAYSMYNRYAPKLGLEQVSGRRLQMLISEIELNGYISTDKIRRHRKITILYPEKYERINEILQRQLGIKI
ncbi:MAG: hypothetical protein QXG08_03600 [Candidatus Methanomethyliaceae archaeon]